MCGGGGGFDPFKAIGDVVSGAGNIFNDIGKTISSVVSTIGKTVENIVQNPLPTIETVALTAAGVPYPISAAAVSAANGGNIQNIALSAAAAYAGNYAGGQIGSNVPGIENLDTTTQTIIQQAVTSSSGSALAAALSGKPLDQILTAGAAGALSGAVAGELKNQGFDAKDLSTGLITNATNAAAKAIIGGKSIGEAITQSSIVAGMNWSLQGASDQIKSAYNDLSSQSDTLQSVNNQFNSLKSEAQNFFQNTLDPAQNIAKSNFDTANGLYSQFNDLQSQYTSKLAEFNQAKSDYANLQSGDPTSYDNNPDWKPQGEGYVKLGPPQDVPASYDPETGSYTPATTVRNPLVIGTHQEYDADAGTYYTVNDYETVTPQSLIDKATALAPQINDIANQANSVASQYQTAADTYQKSLDAVNAAKPTYDGYVRDLTTLQNQAADVAKSIDTTSQTLGDLVGQAAEAEQSAAAEQLQKATEMATNQIIDQTNNDKLTTPEAKQAYADAVANGTNRADAFTSAQNTDIHLQVANMDPEAQKAFNNLVDSGQNNVAAFSTASTVAGLSPIAQTAFNNDFAANKDISTAISTATGVNGLTPNQQTTYSDIYSKTGSTTNALAAAPTLTNASDIAKNSYYEALKQNNGDNQIAISTAAGVNTLPSEQQNFYQFNTDNGLSTTDALKYTPDLSKMSTTALQSFYEQKSTGNTTTDAAIAFANKVNSLNPDQQLSYSNAKANGLSADAAMNLAPTIAGNTVAEQTAAINAIKQGYTPEGADLMSAFAALGDTTGAKLTDVNAANLAKLTTPEAKQAYTELVSGAGGSSISPDKAMAFVTQGIDPITGQKVAENIISALTGSGTAQAGELPSVTKTPDGKDLVESVYRQDPTTGKWGEYIPDGKGGFVNTGALLAGDYTAGPSGSKYVIDKTADQNGVPTMSMTPYTGATTTADSTASGSSSQYTKPMLDTALAAGEITKAEYDQYLSKATLPAPTQDITGDVAQTQTLQDYVNQLISKSVVPTKTGTGTGIASTAGTGATTASTGVSTGTGTGVGTGVGTGTRVGTGVGDGTGIGGVGTGTGIGGVGTGTTPSRMSYSTWSSTYGPNANIANQTGGITNLTPGLTQANQNYTLAGEPMINELLSQNIPQFATGGSPGISDLNAPDNPPTSGISSTLTPGLTKAQLNYILTGLPALNPAGHAEGGEIEGHNPTFFSEGGLGSIDNRYVKGNGDGTSDEVPAMLAHSEFVIPADVVSSLGNGSSDAGAKILDEFLRTIREHKRAADAKELPPDSKGPLGYLLEANKKVKV